ncbi:MAG TPA: hypothetical protein VGX70_12760 [Gemmataceae bacterium]|jgi:hypothetical protein|nr:hypothetical protein [Gemmataceae bacterium]
MAKKTGGRWLFAAKGILCLTLWVLAAQPLTAGELDLHKAVVVSPGKLSKQEKKAVALLVEEVQKRTLIRWEVTRTWPAESIPVIAVGQASSLPQLAGPYGMQLANRQAPAGNEGYQILVMKSGRGSPAVFVIGKDSRGVLFGVGRLLREMHLTRGKITMSDDLSISTVPKFPIRGHQLGYRPKTNSYDGWDLPQWEQYIRDLAVFGTNAVELIPPRSDDDADSPHFPLPPMEMMVGMSRLLDDYGLDVWIWYPAMDADYSKAETVQFALKEWGEVFQKLPRIDAIFVPGGDPGHTPPKVLMALLEKQTENLHRYHPKAQMWVSPQSFTKAWLDEFCEILQNDQPDWMSGVVYGPQVRVPLPELRKMIPAKYPIRRYPDITHSLRCQFPVPDWDVAYALTEAREVINPRPVDEANIFRVWQDSAVGFICYSEGCNDDVNKIVWSSLGWNPDAKIIDILRQYSRYFIGDRYEDDFAQGLLALERNWRGPLLANGSVDTTLEQFRALEKPASPAVKLNWRFQQALYRAYYDAYQRHRLLYETDLENQALDRLRAAKELGSGRAIQRAEAILERAISNRVVPDLRARVFQLAEALFQSIRMQLSVERYQAISVGRGANLDTIDVPLNNRVWLREQFQRIRKLDSESERLHEIDAILNWTNPGPGGFYDDLGDPSRRPHLVNGLPYIADPGYYQSPLTGFHYVPDWRISWCRHAESFYDAPLQMHYSDLDPKSQYRIRVVYAGDNNRPRVRLVANADIEVHPWRAKDSPPRPVEFDIPPQATSKGELNLSWYQEPGRGGAGRGCQVAEVWLMKK